MLLPPVGGSRALTTAFTTAESQGNNGSALSPLCRSPEPTGRHGDHHFLLLLGLSRPSAHHTGGCDDGASATTPPTRGAHHKRTRVNGFLMKRRKTGPLRTREILTAEAPGPQHAQE